MTERIYYTDPSCRTFDATVARAFTHEGHPAVMLDRTAFYPTSGGQPFDTGRLGDTTVLDTIDRDDGIVHVLESALAEGMRVHGEIDWDRRFDHMQQHTGQHVLSAAFDRLFDNRTVSFHMGSEVSTIDLARDLPPADVERAVDEANRVVWRDDEVTIRFVSGEEARRLPLRKESLREGTLRLIEIGEFDLSACGGTHVARTGAIGLIAVLGTERFKGGVRVTFACGGRALRALRSYRDAVAGSVRVLSVVPAELPGAIERLQAEGKDMRKAIARQQEALAVHEAARLRSEAESIGERRVVVTTLDGWDAQGLKAMAAAIVAEHGLAVALLSSSSPVFAVIARSADVPVDASRVLRQLLDRFGGRGGGKPELAQGGGLSGDAGAIADAARTLLAG
ncbi:MAG TPA: DHHA1 domain-containing protein [Vicinamibacterales bacterium]|nr:DHHA1 domain-containing protein [Vicinamibacterales bacterium]